ncbi:TraB/GumN family protein [Variovorax sp. J22G73]|uniref:TraB/GumN family protein n=1 Tax=unclassified Variovorax TaxID=663243 RepID=UPI0025784E2E|nr:MULTISPECIES: TraB/GumN family protein [unclassified Variovorax]MDM0010124.1 TraB/GumN family protein [Variovorax sp. J22R203]MDM0103017.1 TraB/GumN family protein [Variovorax sp. J22G73]
MYYDIVGCNMRILGAVHHLPPTGGAFPSWVWDAFQWSELIEMEHDRAELGACVLDPQTRMLKPWAALFAKLGQAFSSISVLPGVETVFSSALEATRRPPMTYIESGRFLGALLDSVPAPDIGKAEAAMDAAMPNMLANIKRLHSAWEQSNIPALEAAQAESPLGSIASMRHAFFTARNENWANTIASRGAQAKRHLLVVGALHLVGPENLLDQLTFRGRSAVRLIS